MATRRQSIGFPPHDTRVIRPTKLSHVLIRTTQSNFSHMVEFYKMFLGAEVTFKNDFLAFLAYDKEDAHRVGIAAVSKCPSRSLKTCGYDRIGFTYSSLDDLVITYRQRLAHHLRPVWSVNSGLTTSISYRDPDGNMVETQVENFKTFDEAAAYLKSKEFAENPIGADFDPEELVKRIEDGEATTSILKRKEIGKRAIESIPGFEGDKWGL